MKIMRNKLKKWRKSITEKNAMEGMVFDNTGVGQCGA